MSYIESLETVISDSEPANAVPADSGSNNLNDGFGGKSTYLIIHRTDDKESAARWFDVSRWEQQQDTSKYTNYCEGAEGGYRYVITKKEGGDADEDLRVVDVKLFRDKTSFPDFGAAWGGFSLSPDMNTDRGGDYLFLGVKYAS